MPNSFENDFNWTQYFIVSQNVIRQKENSEVEFKEAFHSPRHKDKILLKWIASFANANGGLIIYGVKNNGELIGLKDNRFKEFDSKDLSTELLNFFSPEIKFEIFSKSVENVELGFLYIYPSMNKPVVALKNADSNIHESDIFYRYPGQSKKIGYGELKKIIDERVEFINDKWLRLMNNIATIGAENAGLLNVENGELIGNGAKLLITEELLSKIKFINEGKFVERNGAPALKVLGDVQPLDSTKVVQLVEKKYHIITHFELYQSFFQQNLDKDSAKDFFRRVSYENTSYYPIYYYLNLCEFSMESAKQFIKNEKGAKVREILIRLENEFNNKDKFVIGNISSATTSAKQIIQFIEQLKANKKIEVNSFDESKLRYLIQAITHLTREDIGLDYILTILKKIYDEFFNKSATTKSFIRKAICHIDFIFFGTILLENNKHDSE